MEIYHCGDVQGMSEYIIYMITIMAGCMRRYLEVHASVGDNIRVVSGDNINVTMVIMVPIMIL